MLENAKLGWIIQKAFTMNNAGISEGEGSNRANRISRDQLLSAGGESTNSEAMIGKLIADRYIILGCLGAGAMGTVYKARHKHLNREVALKVLKRDACGDELSRKRFENEAKAASKLHHLNLIAVTDFGFASAQETGGTSDSPFLVMDYVQGQSLSAVLKQQKNLPDEQFLNLMVQICSGLAHAHEKGLIHRDLKPSNILITRGDDDQEVVKIVDFGLAKAINADQDLTNTGQIFGTPLYMSPEQCQGRKLDERSDVYSLGCLMYRMLASKLPFTGDTPVTTIIMHVKETPPAIPADKLSTPFKRELVPIIFKALEKEPPLRHQSVAEMRLELIAAMEGTAHAASSQSSTDELEAAQESSSQPTLVLTKKRAVGMIALFMLLPLILVTAIVAFALNHHHDIQIQPKQAVAQPQQATPPPAAAVQSEAMPQIASPPPVAPAQPKPAAKQAATPAVKKSTRRKARASHSQAANQVQWSSSPPPKKSLLKKLLHSLLD